MSDIWLRCTMISDIKVVLVELVRVPTITGINRTPKDPSKRQKKNMTEL